MPLSVLLPGTRLVRQGPPVFAYTGRYHFLLGDTVMTEKFAPPEVTIRRYPASRICDVVVVVRGQEMVLPQLLSGREMGAPGM